MSRAMAILSMTASLAALAACAPVGSSWSDARQTGLPATGLILNALTVNGVGRDALAAGSTVVSIQLPDGTTASRRTAG